MTDEELQRDRVVYERFLDHSAYRGEDMLRLLDAVEKERRAKDAAYAERNQLVALLAALFPSSLERHPAEDTTWEDDWRWVVFIDLPTGQASWHIHDSEVSLFAHVPWLQGRVWDGHTTEEKYARIRAFLGGDDD